VRAVLLVEPDAECGRATANLLRREGHRVRLVRSARTALQAASGESFDLAVVDLLVPGGGVELARRLACRVRRLYLAVGAPLLPDEIVEAAVGFPVLRKAAVPGIVAEPYARKGRLRAGQSTPAGALRPASRTLRGGTKKGPGAGAL